MNVKFKRTVAIIAASASLCLTFAACSPDDEPYVDERTQVTLNYNDSVSRPRTYFLEDGESMPTPDEPVRGGYQISGWYTQEQGGTKVEFPYTPTESVTTLYAQWKAAEYDVTFNFDFAGSTPYVVKAEYNTEINAPEESVIPQNPGKRFYRWLTPSGDEAVFPYLVRRDAEFKAEWVSSDARTFTVNFNGNFEGAPSYRTLEIPEGRDVRSNQRPNITSSTRPGYTFIGWATTENATADDCVTFPYTPTGDVTFYAVWEIQTFLVRFRKNDYVNGNNNSDVISEERVEAATVVEAPAEPVREGFDFDGWYDAAVGGNKVEFPLTVNATSVMYAHWKANPVTTNKFDAEFTVISPNEYFPVYSGGNNGVQAIVGGNANGATSETYPILGGKETAHNGHYLNGLCRTGGTVTFNIESSADADNVTLYISAAVSSEWGSITVGPSGQYQYTIEVNGTPLSYTPMRLQVGSFTEFTVSANVSLRAGSNEIKLISANSNTNGTMSAACPMLDYIRFDNTGSASLSWRPEYDNLYRAQ